MKRENYLLIVLTLSTLISCDAVNCLHYSVKNKTDESIKIHVPNYPTDWNEGKLSEKIDTIIVLDPNESVWVESSPTDINFPWATKNIYKVTPGICGLELVTNDTLVKLDCTASSWKYKRRWSILKIKR